MLQFLKYVLATFVGIIVFIFLSFFILAGIGSMLSSDDKVVVEDKSVLKLDLNQPIQEVGVDNPLADLGGPFGGDESVVGLKDILEALKNAKVDDKIKGIYLKTEGPDAGWATLEEIRNQLLDFIRRQISQRDLSEMVELAHTGRQKSINLRRAVCDDDQHREVHSRPTDHFQQVVG